MFNEEQISSGFSNLFQGLGVKKKTKKTKTVVASWSGNDLFHFFTLGCNILQIIWTVTEYNVTTIVNKRAVE